MDVAYRKYTESVYDFLQVLLRYRLSNIRYENPCLIMDVDGVLISEKPSNSLNVPLPGAIEFVEFCTNANVPIFIITNRRTFNEKILQDLGFPKFANVYYNEKSDDTETFKYTKREEVAKDHEIILCIGDKLHDIVSDEERHGEPILIMNPY